MKPEINSIWVHTKGTKYTVIDFTNETSTDERYPLTVIYADEKGNKWSRPLSDWYRSMTLDKS